jgi:hypothetical protein
VHLAHRHQADVGVDDVDMKRQQVPHGSLQRCGCLAVPALEPQEPEEARLVDVGRNHLALNGNWLGESLDRETNVHVDALEQLAVESG